MYVFELVTHLVADGCCRWLWCLSSCCRCCGCCTCQCRCGASSCGCSSGQLCWYCWFVGSLILGCLGCSHSKACGWYRFTEFFMAVMTLWTWTGTLAYPPVSDVFTLIPWLYLVTHTRRTTLQPSTRAPADLQQRCTALFINCVFADLSWISEIQWSNVEIRFWENVNPGSGVDKWPETAHPGLLALIFNFKVTDSPCCWILSLWQSLNVSQQLVTCRMYWHRHHHLCTRSHMWNRIDSLFHTDVQVDTSHIGHHTAW